ncbi:MAG: hypothetical protein JW940_25055 [Polyangiaceae bacterium]|nr:hypothetical protein [Polyangiaceae bacterium]
MSTLIDWSEPTSVLVVSTVRAGALLGQRRFGRDSTVASVPGSAARALPGLVSARVLEWCERETVVRGGRSADPHLLAVLLQGAGATASQAVL